MKFTCSKLYSDFPAAHRQHLHAGHCALIHGHNWSFEITFAADKLDANHFVVDFGLLGEIKRWLTDMFDHTLLLNQADTVGLRNLLPLNGIFARIVLVPNCGAEGLAKFVAEEADSIVCRLTKDRVRVSQVVCFEDSKNKATFAF